MLTDEQIAFGKENAPTRLEGHHEHNDCIRIAYEWLDAQTKTKHPVQRTRALKHIIEKWGGRYVSQTDVEVAAWLHPDIIGEYPRFNVSMRMTRPSARRLEGIGESGKHQNYRETESAYKYSRDEP